MLENYHAYYDYDSCGGSCGGDCPPTPTPVYVTSVSVTPSYLSMKVGEWSYAPYASVLPSNADNRTVQWYSNDSSIASVNSSSGYVYANSEGTTQIYAVATDGSGCRDYLTVSVSRRVLVSTVEFDYTSVTLEKGDSWQIHATICPYNADNTGLRWESSNTDIATVSNGLVTAVSRGTATITATARDGSGARAICTVYVTETIPVTSVNVSPQYKSMYCGTSSYVYATVSPCDATNSEVLWSSSDECVATVNPDSGLVWARCAGTAVIRATARDGSGVSGCCYLTVTEQILVQNIYLNHYDMTLPVNSSGILEASICPENATNKTILWTSSNTQVASINGAGTVVARGIGTATITASTYDNSGVTACCQVTVVPVPIEKVELNKTKMFLGKDEVVQLQCNVTPRNATVSTVTWESSPGYVASVSSSGAVTALADGTATVTVRVNGTYTATCEVVVDTREKVVIEKALDTDNEEYFKIKFDDGSIWKSIGCDLSLDVNRSGGLMSDPDDERLNCPERRHMSNVSMNFSARQLAFAYLCDPLGVEFYMNRYDTSAHPISALGLMCLKDEIYKNIFGRWPRLFRELPDGQVSYVVYTQSQDVRPHYYSDAEIMFGGHTIVDFLSLASFAFNVINSIALSIFSMASDSFGTFMTAMDISKLLLFNGAVEDTLASGSSAALSEYVNNVINSSTSVQAVRSGLSSRFGWAMNVLDLIPTILDAAGAFAPSLNEMKVYTKIDSENFRTCFLVDGDEMSLQELLENLEN